VEPSWTSHDVLYRITVHIQGDHEHDGNKICVVHDKDMDHRLVYDGKGLDHGVQPHAGDDGGTLEEHGVPDGALVHLRAARIPIKVVLPSGEVLEPWVNPDEDDAHLRLYLKEEYGLDLDWEALMFVHGTFALDETYDLTTQGVKAGSTLKVVDRVMKVHFHYRREVITTEAAANETAKELRMALQEQEGPGHDDYSLVFGGQLIDEKARTSLRDLGVTHGARIELVRENMRIHFLAPGLGGAPPRLVRIDVDGDGPVSEVKQVVSGIIDRAPEDFELAGKRFVLEANAEFDNCQDALDARDSKTPLEVVDAVGRFSVEVPGGGRKVEVKADLHSLVGDIKDLIRGAGGVNLDLWELYCGDTWLEHDEEHIINYGLRPGSVIALKPKSLEQAKRAKPPAASLRASLAAGLGLDATAQARKASVAKMHAPARKERRQTNGGSPTKGAYGGTFESRLGDRGRSYRAMSGTTRDHLDENELRGLKQAVQGHLGSVKADTEKTLDGRRGTLNSVYGGATGKATEKVRNSGTGQYI